MGHTGWRGLAILLWVGTALLACVPALAARSMSLSGYIDELTRQHSSLEEILEADDSAAAMERGLRRLSGETLQFDRVTVTAAQSSMELEVAWVRKSLVKALNSRNKADRRSILVFLEKRMRLAIGAMRKMGDPVPADPGARAALQQILDSAEFEGLDEKENWVTRLRDRLRELLRSLMEKSGGALRYVFNVPVAIAVVLLSLAYAAWRLSLRPRSSSISAEPPERRVLLTLGHDKLLQQAHEAADAEDFRKAIRFLYLALLVRLDRAGRLHYLPWKTNREYLDGLRAASPSLADVFGPFTFFFERKWYGMESCGPSDYAEGLRLYKNVLGGEGL